MPQPERFEILVLGSGNGGMFLAWHMARSGRRTAVVERRLIGGSCPQHQLSSEQERDLERESL
jgi:pyruvate/2-oxoglutarate dehydrogenase complex dihydrolipoamide dehydrogenase (E3) component